MTNIERIKRYELTESFLNAIKSIDNNQKIILFLKIFYLINQKYYLLVHT